VQTSSSMVKISTDGVFDGIGRDHVDAFPRANVNATLASYALALIDVNELFWLNRLGKPRRIDLLQDIVGPELWKRRVGVENTH